MNELKTKGHILSDAQFAEYTILKENRYDRNISIRGIEFIGDYLHPNHMDCIIGIINIDGVKSKEADEVIAKIEDWVLRNNKEAKEIPTSLKHYFNNIRASVSRLEKQREKLRKCPTIWEFLKERRKFRKYKRKLKI